MREIKFRAWDNKNKKMYDDIMYASNGELFGGNYVYLQFDYSIYIEDLIVEQYTGLKDKNGVEIYEGDIIQHYAFEKGNTFTVEYDKYEGWCGYGSLGEWSQCEVIGNIHEGVKLT